jgi:hypothetical protein
MNGAVLDANQPPPRIAHAIPASGSQGRPQSPNFEQRTVLPWGTYNSAIANVETPTN